MPNWISVTSRALTYSEMEHNARIIYDALVPEGWTPNAVCAMLGNMQLESTINPGRWENDTVGTGGFGLTQWTPASKLQTFIRETYGSTDYANGDFQMGRILYEVDHPGVQWIATASYPLSFPQFTQSNESLPYLVAAFEYNYERGTPVLDIRTRYAQYWWDVLTGRPRPRKMPIWLMFKMIERRFSP